MWPTGTMWRYVDEAQRHAAEIATEAIAPFGSDEAGAEAVRAAIATMTFAEWSAWRGEHARELQALARSTPSARRRRKRTPELLASLAAYQFCLEAALLLDVVEHLGPGGGYRETTGYAGEAATEFVRAFLDIRAQDFWGDPLAFRDS